MTNRILVGLLFVGLSSSRASAQDPDPLPPLPGAEAVATASDTQPEPHVPAEEAAAPEAKTAEPAMEGAEPQEQTSEQAMHGAEKILGVQGGTLRLAAADDSVPDHARDALDAAVEALIATDAQTARALLAQVRAALSEDHWLLPTVGRLEQLAGVLERGLARGSVEDESVASLYITLTLYGFYTGIWLFGFLGEADFQATVPLSVATAGVGLGAAYLLDHGEEPLTGAVADGISAGLFLGTAEAALLLAAVNPDNLSAKGWASVIWVSSLLGGVVGGAAVQSSGASRGDVALATAGYTWGAVLGLCAALVISPSDDDDAMKAILGGATAGFGVGLGLARHYDMSASRVLYINLGGLAGALVGIAIAVGGSFDNAEPVGATLGLTYVAGLAAGWHLTRDLDLPESPVALQTTPTLIPSLDPTRPPAPGMAVTFHW